MEQVLIGCGVAAVALAIAALLRRRTEAAAPTQPRQWSVPAQLDRQDFPAATDWLVVVFSSATCETCRSMVDKARVLASQHVAVEECEYGEHRRLHERYAIDAVPITVIADRMGVVRASFVGPASATDLWAAVAEARDPGSSPEPGLGQGRDSAG